MMNLPDVATSMDAHFEFRLDFSFAETYEAAYYEEVKLDDVVTKRNDVKQNHVIDDMRRIPTPLDVCGTRGTASNHHQGNRRMWLLVLHRREEYVKGNSEVKRRLIQEVEDGILTEGGLFLTRLKGSREWSEMSPKEYRDKIQTALRGKYVPQDLTEMVRHEYPFVYRRYLEKMMTKQLRKRHD